MKRKLTVLGIVLLVLIAGAIIAKPVINSNQAHAAYILQVELVGEYKVGDGEWQPIIKGEHIPSNRGEVVLRGTLQKVFPDGEVLEPVQQGEQVAMYLDHIGGYVYINGVESHMFEAENDDLGNDSCGKMWNIYEHTGTAEDEVEIRLKNPHIFGKEMAVDELLSSMYMYVGYDFERRISEETEDLRLMGTGIIIVAVLLLGIALFSTLIRLDVDKIMWLAGATLLFAGSYFVIRAASIYSWNTNVALHTAILLLSIMLYVFFLQTLISYCFVKPMRKAGYWICVFSGVVTAAALITAFCLNIKLYDAFSVWLAIQLVINLILLGCSCINIRYLKGSLRWLQVVFIASICFFILDIAGTYAAWWGEPFFSTKVFIIQFFVALFVALRVFPESIKAAMREKDMQAELEKNKTAVMLSQIQPHFLYNSLGAIRELCRQDPEEARNALGIFITYLRGNMDSIQREHTIHFSQELNHISAYLQLEKMRFGDDLDVIFDVQEKDFFIPSLTVQPLVENAVKHGICGREDGGTVTLHTHREEDTIIIKIQDDGVGFDTNQLAEIEHVGIQNVRNRLKHIVDGSLDIDSTENVGTVATITIQTGRVE